MPGRNGLETTMQPNVGATETDAHMGRIAAFIDDFSIETVPASSREITSFGAHLRPGATVYVGSPPTRDPGEVVDTARLLHQAGFRPVPHIAACAIADRDRLEDLLHRLTSQADVDQVLVIGGSRVKPVGEFRSASQILETGLLEEFGIRRVGVAGYPEGHPEIPQEELLAALREKIAYGQRTGAEIHIVTQFCFDPGRVVSWEKHIRSKLGSIPVHVGIAGPASFASLVKYARICGIGQSVRFLTRGASALHKLPVFSPDYFLAAIAEHKALDPRCAIEKAHFYSFGGTARTARWLAAIRAGPIAAHPDGRGNAVAAASERPQ